MLPGFHHPPRFSQQCSHLQFNTMESLCVHLSACRFGLNQALIEWPDNEVAKEGLQRALTRMIHYEVEVGSSRAAAALITALPFAERI